MNINTKLVKTFLLTATIAGTSLGGAASAASACKGLADTACNNNASCNWVNGYERKDGRKVKAFCRTKSTVKQDAKQKSASQKQQASG